MKKFSMFEATALTKGKNLNLFLVSVPLASFTQWNSSCPYTSAIPRHQILLGSKNWLEITWNYRLSVYHLLWIFIDFLQICCLMIRSCLDSAREVLKILKKPGLKHFKLRVCGLHNKAKIYHLCPLLESMKKNEKTV